MKRTLLVAANAQNLMNDDLEASSDTTRIQRAPLHTTWKRFILHRYFKGQVLLMSLYDSVQYTRTIYLYCSVSWSFKSL